jgi:hypothetical protein
MDLGSRDFALNFRGFEHNDPAAFARFAHFCHANFALSPEAATLLASRPDCIVLTRGRSFEELEALAEVLRDIGAQVDVSEAFSGPEQTLLASHPEGEIHRVFIEENLETHLTHDLPRGRTRRRSYRAGPYTPLQITTPRGDAIKNWGVPRHQKRLAVRGLIPDERTPTAQRSLSARAVTLAIVLAGIIFGAYTFMPPLITKKEELPTKREFILSKHPFLPSSASPARLISGTTSQGGFKIALKVMASDKLVSVSSLLFVANEARTEGDNNHEISVARVEGDPAFLREETAGRWVGVVPVSLFIKEGGEVAQFTTPAQVVVRIPNDTHAPTASIEFTESRNPGAIGEANGFVFENGNNASKRSLIQAPAFTLSLSEELS